MGAITGTMFAVLFSALAGGVVILDTTIEEVAQQGAGYRVTTLLEGNAAGLRRGKRLILLGYGNFRTEHQQAHALLERLKVPHEYRDGPARTHDWHSGWVKEAAELLLAPDGKD